MAIIPTTSHRVCILSALGRRDPPTAGTRPPAGEGHAEQVGAEVASKVVCRGITDGPAGYLIHYVWRRQIPRTATRQRSSGWPVSVDRTDGPRWHGHRLASPRRAAVPYRRGEDPRRPPAGRPGGAATHACRGPGAGPAEPPAHRRHLRLRHSR